MLLQIKLVLGILAGEHSNCQMVMMCVQGHDLFDTAVSN